MGLMPPQAESCEGKFRDPHRRQRLGLHPRVPQGLVHRGCDLGPGPVPAGRGFPPDEASLSARYAVGTDATGPLWSYPDPDFDR
jgi:hypothetical protein